MRITALLLAGALGLAACTPTADTNNALIGAGIGAVAADLADQNVVTGAAIGAAAGALANDAGVVR